MSAKAITMSDFNASLEEATSVTDSDAEFDESWDAAVEITESIAGFCGETGERFNDALTVQNVISMLCDSLHREAGMSREAMIDMLDATVYRRDDILEATVLTRPERKELN